MIHTITQHTVYSCLDCGIECHSLQEALQHNWLIRT